MANEPRTLSATYPAQPRSIPRARRALTDFALVAGAGPRQLEDIRLASSEALTNAVVHAYSGEPGLVHVTAAVASGELWVLIADDGCGMQPRADRPGLGLGLGLIAQMSDELAVVSRADGGTEVRMRFDLVSATPQDPDVSSGAVARGSSSRAKRSRSSQPLR
jgi:anti-sigma regulatory factor (Ser/Thr protein kinase)